MEQYINIFRIYDKIMKNYLDIYSLFLIGYLFGIYKIDKNDYILLNIQRALFTYLKIHFKIKSDSTWPYDSLLICTFAIISFE